jgi:hypothetical protein
MSADRYSIQSFLGADFEEFMACCTLGISGLGGCGSQVVQQLAHIGFKNYVLYDDEVDQEAILDRSIATTVVDTFAKTPKLQLAKMMIYGIQPHANVRGFPCSWQEYPEPMRDCQIVFGCADGYKERQDLEIACRRYLMHYIDVGMDLRGTDRPVIRGRVILSSPGGLCMKCMGFLDDQTLAQEARYGTVERSQVIWPNGVLASTAVGLAVDLITNWTRKQRSHAYLVYDGNEGTVKESATLRQLNTVACPHFDASEIGDAVLVGL